MVVCVEGNIDTLKEYLLIQFMPQDGSDLANQIRLARVKYNIG